MRWTRPAQEDKFSRLVSVIAIDGPVAAGKTAVGRALAGRLGFKCLDTGIMYRAITWLAIQRGTSMEDAQALGSLAREHPLSLSSMDGDHVEVAGHSLGPELRNPWVNGQVSLVAKVPAVRRALVRQQRLLGAEGNIVMLGRDIGSVVLPGADLKVFLSASPESRAARRWMELLDQGQNVELEQVLEETKARDNIDSHRADSPLALAPDAFLVDTEELGVEPVVERILEQIQKLSKSGEA